MRRRVRNNGFCTNVVASCGSSSRAGLRRPRLRPASVPRRLRPNLKPFVILNEVDRRTQREQRPLADYAEQGGERQTQCSQESVYVYLIQILRRSAPQNDKTGRTEIRTTRWDRTISLFANSAADWNKQLAATRKGWREKMFGATAACRDKHRRSAVRAEAPPCGGSQNSPRGLRHENNSHTAIKTDKTSCQTTANEQRFSFNPPAPLRRQRTAESANHADANHDPHHSGCEVAGSEDKTKIIHAEKFTGETDEGSESECKEKHSMA